MCYGAFILIHDFGDMHREADCAQLVHKGAFNILFDPPGSIRAQLKAFAIIELFNGPDKAQVALGNDIRKRQPPIDVFFGDGDDKPAGSIRSSWSRFLVPLEDPLAQFLLVRKGKEGRLPDFLQIALYRVDGAALLTAHALCAFLRFRRRNCLPVLRRIPVTGSARWGNRPPFQFRFQNDPSP